MEKSKHIIEKTNYYGAHNYKPLPMVISKAQGVWVEDPEGNRYMDMLSAYSALNHGHRHPAIIQALKDQADHVTLTSRAFHNDRLGDFYEKLSKITGKERILPMNTGAEAVETAVKMARKWGYEVKGISPHEALILVAKGNFHGRTTTITSFSSEESYKKGFGPFTPGFVLVEYGDISSLKREIQKYGSDKVAAILLEPIQGEAGIVIPPAGYLKEVSQLCQEHHMLLMADEIQTGLGRTGKMFACDWEEVVPDVYIIGKALGGGVFPISAVAANQEVMDVFTPGTHGSTFGGNPLGCAVALAALDVLETEKLVKRSYEQGTYLLQELQKIQSPLIKEIRGKGLFIGIELHEKARPYCESLMQKGVLCKETHDFVIRLAPPLTITKEELNWAIPKIKEVLETK